ncbi:MAG TPA: EAL domain-containing protein, partial [Pseudoduganella sp.]
MKKRPLYVLALLAIVIAVCLPPWLAMQEAERQALRAESDLVQGYARDVLRRFDETGRQALVGIARLERSGLPPCSADARALMRDIDLTSTYLQAIGYARDGDIVCSSMGADAIPLGAATFRSASGADVYTRIPLANRVASALVGIGKDGFVALFHRDLPLDTWTAVPEASLAVIHLDMREGGGAMAQRGFIDVRWLSKVGDRQAATFTADGYMVAVLRSPIFRTAAIAAVPLSYVRTRTMDLALRLVPAGVLAGLALAGAIVLLARQQMSLASALRQGLRRNEFFLAYQPIVELATGRWVGVEALLRWRRSNGELIGPDLFIPVAEQSSTITKLTERVLHLIRQDAGDFLAAHPAFHIAVNLSAADLASLAIVGQLDHLMKEAGASPSNLIVEITERGLVDMVAARPVIAALRSRGIELAIDDFGTGYSSLSYLETLELDFLKIDRSFIDAIGTRAPTNQVVRHIIAMARALDLRMIAEGVETEAHAEYLVEHGVQFAQGWLFAKAMPFPEIRGAIALQGPSLPPVLV